MTIHPTITKTFIPLFLSTNGPITNKTLNADIKGVHAAVHAHKQAEQQALYGCSILSQCQLAIKRNGPYFYCSF